MNLRKFAVTFLFVALTLFLAGQAAIAADAVTQVTPSACGPTVEDKLAAARKALQSDDKATRAALACLIEATSALNKRLQASELGGQQSGMLHAPVSDVPVQPSRR
jgi:hypothetical protein